MERIEIAEYVVDVNKAVKEVDRLSAAIDKLNQKKVYRIAPEYNLPGYSDRVYKDNSPEPKMPDTSAVYRVKPEKVQQGFVRSPGKRKISEVLSLVSDGGGSGGSGGGGSGGGDGEGGGESAGGTGFWGSWIGQLTKVYGLFRLLRFTVRAILNDLKEMREIYWAGVLTGSNSDKTQGLTISGQLAGFSESQMISAWREWSRNSIELRTNLGGAAYAFRLMGINARDAHGNVRPLLELMKEASLKLKQFSPADRELLANRAFGNQAIAETVLRGKFTGQEGGWLQGNTQASIKMGERVATAWDAFLLEVQAFVRALIGALGPILMMGLDLLSFLLRLGTIAAEVFANIWDWIEKFQRWVNGDFSGGSGDRKLSKGQVDALNGTTSVSLGGAADFATSMIQSILGGSNVQIDLLTEARAQTKILTGIAANGQMGGVTGP